MGCKPVKWLWGLPAVVAIGVLALYGTGAKVESDLEARTQTALQEAGLQWATASFDGRDAVLEGLSFSRQERDTALRIISSIWGVRNVVDKSDLIASPDTYTWLAVKEDERIKIRGHVPTKADRQAVLGFIKAAMPDLEVDDKSMLAGGSPPRQEWLGAVSFALIQLGQLKAGSVHLAGTNLSVRGEAKTTEAYRNFQKLPGGQLPAGMELKVGRVEPPVIKPYSTRVKYNGSTIQFGGHALNEEARDELVRRARSLFPDAKIEDTMQIASGAPEGWRWALSASMIQLRRLVSGRVKLEGNDLELEGIANDEGTVKDITEAITFSFPSAFKVSNKLAVREEEPTQKPPAN
ncbi:MAG: BON domain-containing protein [Hyphomicrobiaceae bacterium]|nr:BON domain-containing protein [Hyphomicrobiaceae bacterium]